MKTRPRAAIEAMERRLHLSYTLHTLASFNSSTGEGPRAAVTLDASGNLFSTTEYGGKSGDGTVFEIARGSTVLTTLASFNGVNGDLPYAAVIMDAGGNLFSTTDEGGNLALNNGLGDGTVFEIAHGSTVITTLASFNGANGANPDGAVTLDASGNLFSTTYRGGSGGFGTVFEIAHGSTAVTTLASFNVGNGQNPGAALTLDGSGNLFSTTEYGGDSGGSDGTVFEIAHGSTSITTLASFNSANGATGSLPNAAVVFDGAGNLFSTTFEGGKHDNDGTVFEIARGSTVITTLASFNGANGANPQGGVILDTSGDLLGTTLNGGNLSLNIGFGDGTIFEIAHGSTVISTLVKFNGANGALPFAGLTPDASGNLLTTTYNGGSKNVGAVIELTPAALVLPAWLAPTSQATWNGTGLTITGPSTIIADPGADEPNIVASGPAAQLTITPTVADVDVHVGGITLTGGAGITVASVGAGRGHSNHNILVVGTTGEPNDPVFTIDSSSKLDLQDNDLVVHVDDFDPNGSSVLPALQRLAAAGRDGGAWDGNQLTSTSAQTQNNNDGLESVQLAAVNNADLPSPLAVWQVGNASEPLGGHDIIVKYTYTGDFNLDGQVNFNDSCIFGLYYDNGATANNEWAFGDTNGDGKLTFADSSNFGLDFGNGTSAGIDPTQL